MSKHIKSVAELVAQHPVKGELIMKQLEGTLKSLVDKLVVVYTQYLLHSSAFSGINFGTRSLANFFSTIFR